MIKIEEGIPQGLVQTALLMALGEAAVVVQTKASLPEGGGSLLMSSCVVKSMMLAKEGGAEKGCTGQGCSLQWSEM
eukprot:1157681-Pelagomonas_calceolata.AAC.11